jgi:hypothetical protein
MIADPGEKNDIAKQHPGVVADLSDKYEAWYDDIASSKLERPSIQVGHADENPVTICAPQAYFEGELKFDHGPGFAHDWLTGWTDREAEVWFDIDVIEAGTYDVALQYGCSKADAGSTLRIRVGEQERNLRVPAAEAPVIPLPHRDARSRGRYVNRRWGDLEVGEIQLPAGRQRLSIRATAIAGDQALELKGVTLERIENP